LTIYFALVPKPYAKDEDKNVVTGEHYGEHTMYVLVVSPLNTSASVARYRYTYFLFSVKTAAQHFPSKVYT